MTYTAPMSSTSGKKKSDLPWRGTPPGSRKGMTPKLGLRGSLLSLVFIVAGPLHFVYPAGYLRIMPPYLPHPLALVYLSGLAELLGGAGLLIAYTRRAAAWGLVALLIAVWPANVYMATAHLQFPGLLGQSWAQWVRVALQIPLIYWAWSCTKR